MHIKSNDMPQELNAIIQDAFASGAQVIYYEALFNNNSEWITIAGDSKFTKESAFYPSDSIVIVVHTFKNKGCEDITQKK